MVAYATRFGVGFAGAVSRQEASTIEPETFNSANMPTAFGVALRFTTTNGVTNVEPAVGSGDVVVGFLARPFVDIGAAGYDAFGAEAPRVGSNANLLRRGYIVVKLATGDYTAGTCLKGTPVYLRTTVASSPARPVGGLADSSGSTGTTVIPGAVFMGPPDANGFTEIAYNI